jgi:hypothetical protein
LQLKNRFNLLPMAVKNANTAADGKGFWVNPPDNITLKTGLVVIVMGDVEDVRRARGDANHNSVFATSKRD